MYKIPAKTVFLGKNLIYVPECHSTSSLLKEWLHERELPEGTLVITDCQTYGRGQRGNTWESEPGKNLTFSFLLRPTFMEARNQFDINMAISVGIAAALNKMLDEAALVKWPNDIMIEDKKVCGILIENSILGTFLTDVTVGIGLNVNQASFGVATAGSLSQFSGTSLNLDEVLGEVITEIERCYLMLRSGQVMQIREQYLDRLYWHRQPHIFETNGTPFVGMISGIDSEGRLCIQSENGIKRFLAKEVQYKA